MARYDLDDLGRDWDNEDDEGIFDVFDHPDAIALRNYRDMLHRLDVKPIKPCPCACNYAGWCGGCGHAGCGGR